MNTTTPTRLSDLPLWRLLVALDDAERTFGGDSATARLLAREISRRLANEPQTSPNPSRSAAPSPFPETAEVGRG